MTSEIISRATCLAELTSNPRSFYNCPDMHGGSGWSEGARRTEQGAEELRGKGEVVSVETLTTDL